MIKYFKHKSLVGFELVDNTGKNYMVESEDTGVVVLWDYQSRETQLADLGTILHWHVKIPKYEVLLELWKAGKHD